jgi:hypothetical protein
VPIDQVSVLLGHSSVKITERHYAPFCKARQEQLTAAVKLAWPKPKTPAKKGPGKSKAGQPRVLARPKRR